MMSINHQENGSYAALDTRAMGICATCIYVDKCTSRRNWHGPVYFCEEFYDELHIPRKPVSPKKAKPSTSQAKSSANGRIARGLCVNCRHRDECMLPRPESGVWHCEEYE